MEVILVDCQKVGQLIYTLRKEKEMTQKELAELMHISDKTISKWERGLGCPDISLLPKLSHILGVRAESILKGQLGTNDLVGGNMKRVKFYVCPQCHNFITATGETSVSCCGRNLEALVPKKASGAHSLKLEEVEEEWYITSEHEMMKSHYISFIAFTTDSTLSILKQYPEWAISFRYEKLRHGKIYFYCTGHGLFYQNIR